MERYEAYIQAAVALFLKVTQRYLAAVEVMDADEDEEGDQDAEAELAVLMQACIEAFGALMGASARLHPVAGADVAAAVDALDSMLTDALDDDATSPSAVQFNALLEQCQAAMTAETAGT
jgi:hypothetical protein